MASKDPYRSFNFLVEIDGVVQGGFTEVSGLSATTEPIEYREGGDTATPRKLPGLTKYANLVLKRGLSDGRELHDWHREVVQGRVSRRNGSVIVLDVDGVTEVLRWNFFRAWPCKLEGPSLNAKNNEVAIETLEIAHEGIERA